MGHDELQELRAEPQGRALLVHEGLGCPLVGPAQPSTAEEEEHDRVYLTHSEASETQWFR